MKPVFGFIGAVLLLSEGCYPDPYKDRVWPDSETIGDDYADVIGLPVCESGWVRLPPSSDEVNRTSDRYFYADVHQLVYGDADWSGTPASLYPVVYRTFAQDEHPVGWTVYGSVEYITASWIVHYAPFNGWDESTQPFTLACAASAL